MDNILLYYLTPMSKIHCGKKSTANSVISVFSDGFDIIAAISHRKPSIVLSHGLSRLASHKDCKPANVLCKQRNCDRRIELSRTPTQSPSGLLSQTLPT